MSGLLEAVDQALPQTQCTRCGYPDCRSYAQAITHNMAAINQCPPGGAEGVARLAQITERPVQALNPANGQEGPRMLAVIDEDWCIGCTLCIKACPVDCIVGTNKRMHVVIAEHCTGCELCLPVCPVDCIALVKVSDNRTGWDAWDRQLAANARDRYDFRQFRTQRDSHEHDERMLAKAQHKHDHIEAASKLTAPADLERKRDVIAQALARARAKRNDA